MDSFASNKNEKQLIFNSIKGTIIEIEQGEVFSCITIQVGHENTRLVNLTSKTKDFKEIINGFNINDKVFCRFFVTSRRKNDKWYNNINLLSIDSCD